jgi:RNase H-like domain found in reverse transcriptase
MTDVLRELISKVCHVYLNDIIIWSQTLEEHEQSCTTVLEALRKASIYCNQVKCNLFATELCFLSHISGTSIKPDPCKTDHIASWPQPMTATNVRGFLGLTRYIATFLPALAEYTSVLTPLTTKECNQEFPPWTTEHQAAFKHIEVLVLSADCLTIINYEDMASNIYVTTDASNHRTSAMLSFGTTWETAQPVAYDSYQLNDAEKNYPVHKKELLAIIKTFMKWRSYLFGTHFQVFTNHQTLEYFQSQKEMSR